jgi:hypothetical protein
MPFRFFDRGVGQTGQFTGLRRWLSAQFRAYPPDAAAGPLAASHPLISSRSLLSSDVQHPPTALHPLVAGQLAGRLDRPGQFLHPSPKMA